MIKGFKHITGIVCLIFFLISCEKESCHDPVADNFNPAGGKTCNDCCVYSDNREKVSLFLNISHYVRSEEFEYGRTYFLQDSRMVQFDFSKFYLSGIRFISNTYDTISFSDSVYLIDPGKSLINAGDIAIGNYTELLFTFGVPESLNHISPTNYPQGHPLSYQSPSMHWEIEPGYLFFRLQGRIDSQLPPDAVFDSDLIYHIGTNSNRKEISLPVSLEVLPMKDVQINIKLDYNALFTGITLREHPVTMTLASQQDSINAAFFAENLLLAFQLESYK